MGALQRPAHRRPKGYPRQDAAVEAVRIQIVTLEVKDTRFDQALTNARYRLLSASDVIGGKSGKSGNRQAGPLVDARIAAATPLRLT